MKKKQSVSLKIPKIIQLPSGAYSTKVMVDGKRHTITRETEGLCAAEAAAIKYRAKVAEENRQLRRVTLSDAIDQYIDKRRGKKSPSTIRGYLAYKNNCLTSMMSANVFTTKDSQWQSAVDTEFSNLSPKYAKNVWSFFAAAIEEQTGSRPKIYLKAGVKSERPFLDSDQVLVFVRAIKGSLVEVAALLELSSLRISEVLDVRGTDIDFKNNRIRVKGSAVIDEAGTLVHKDENKNNTSARYVPLIPPLKEALEDMDLSDDYIVKLSAASIYKRINRICKQNNLPQVGNHGLRHSFASLAFHLGIPPEIAAEIGGWADIGTMRRIYTHLSQKDIAKRSQDFSNFFK